MRILIISQDSPNTSTLLKGLQVAGFSADHAHHTEQDSFWVRSTDYDLVLLELADNGQVDATEICKNIRARGKTMPIIVVSGSTTISQKVAALEAGADDIVHTECSIAELTARVRAALRRPPVTLGNTLELDDLTLDTVKYKVQRGNKSIPLTRKEFGLLEYLLRNKDAVISRSALIEHVWDINADLFSNTLETHILNLRRKIESPRKRKLIHTISGRGYKIALEP